MDDRGSRVKISKICLYTVPLLLVAGIAYGNFKGGSEPTYVTEAMSAVSNKMSYDYGIATCKANQYQVEKWKISCMSANTPTALSYSVLPAEKAPYSVPTPFYLIADNDVARKAAGEGLLSFMMIDIRAEADQVKQLATN